MANPKRKIEPVFDSDEELASETVGLDEWSEENQEGIWEESSE
jgi:hypothetical protein